MLAVLSSKRHRISSADAPRFLGASVLCAGLLLGERAHAGARIVRQQLEQASGTAPRQSKQANVAGAATTTVASAAPASGSASAGIAGMNANAYVTPGVSPLVGPDTAAAPAAVVVLDKVGVELRAGAGVLLRSLSFSQDVYDRMRKQNTSAMVYRLDAGVYPFFHGVPWAGHVGLVGGYEGTLSGSVSDADFGYDYDISYSELYGGLRVRGDVRQHSLGFNVTLNRLQSGLDDGGLSGIPDVVYTQVRTALDGTFVIGPVRATAAAGFRVPLSYGEISDATWFPRIGGYGVDLALGASYPVLDKLAIDVGASMRHFLLEMNAQPEDALEGDAEVAAGATDSYWSAYIGMSFAL